MIIINPNKKLKQYFIDLIYIALSVGFTIFGGLFAFFMLRKKRRGFAWFCLILGMLSFFLSLYLRGL